MANAANRARPEKRRLSEVRDLPELSFGLAAPKRLLLKK